jgi:biotin synthase
MDSIQQDIQNGLLDRQQLVSLLGLEGEKKKQLLELGAKVMERSVGKKVYFRGLIEFSNICTKDCFYCGIRKSNGKNKRFNLSDEEIIEAALFAHSQNYASVVLQSGELASENFTQRIATVLKKIHHQTNGTLRVTLSLGEQTPETYKHWYENGAHRYLLRIETSNEQLYQKIHPMDQLHSFGDRLRCLESLKKIGYQTGTGVMIGLPFQTCDDLANDLLYMKNFGIDMVGMGPYLEHADTPLYQYRSSLLSVSERFQLTLKMIALLRIMMPNINIAAATALQAIDNMGREKAIRAGANVIMPNITPGKYRDRYKLYDNKPCTDESADDCTGCLSARIAMTGNQIGFGEWGDSLYFTEKVNKITEAL